MMKTILAMIRGNKNSTANDSLIIIDSFDDNDDDNDDNLLHR